MASPRVGITDNCELHNLVGGNQTQSFPKAVCPLLSSRSLTLSTLQVILSYPQDLGHVQQKIYTIGIPGLL